MSYLELKYMVLRYYELHPEEAEKYKTELEYLKIAEYFPEVIFCNNAARVACRDLKHNVSEVANNLKEVDLGSNLKIYFPKEYTIDDALNAVTLLVAEQSVESAHKYARVPQNTAVFDIGASEGFFSRLYCDQTNEIFGFDDSMWMDSYLKTMSGYDASFVPGLVRRDSKFDFDIYKPLGCIKVDVEGTELDVLECFKGLIEGFHPQIQVAVYHYKEEADFVVNWLRQVGYTQFGQIDPDRVMLYMNPDQRPPFFRHGVIIANP